MKKHALFALVLCLAGFLQAEAILTWTAAPYAGPPPAVGDTLEIPFEADIKPEWHIWGNALSDSFLIPTRFSVRTIENAEVVGVRYPQSVRKTLMGITENMFEGRRTFVARVKVIHPGTVTVEGVLHFQGCNNQTCVAPTDQAAVSRLEMQSAPATGIEGRLSRYGLLTALLFLFVSGIGLCLTPCVYPVIPVTLSFFAGQASDKKSQTALLAMFYTLGIAFTYSLLGTLAALSGTILGSALQHPAVTWFIAALFVALSLSMFGLYEFRVPSFISALGMGRRGFAGAFFMGLIVGILAAPCVGPVTAGLLIFVAQKHDPLLGFLYFFALSLGLGAPFFVLGLFSGSIKKLPGSGGWLLWIRKFFGFVLLGVALYYLKSAFPAPVVNLLNGILVVAASLYLGFMEKSAGGERFVVFRRFQKAFGVLLLTAGFLYLSDKPMNPFSASPVQSNHGEEFSETRFAALKASGKPFVLDFRADWCAPCRLFEAEVLSDARVKEAIAPVPVQPVDLTRQGDPGVEQLIREFGIVGVPTIIFYKAGGIEAARFTRMMDKEEFVSNVNQIKGE